VEYVPGVSPLGTHTYATLSELADAWHD